MDTQVVSEHWLSWAFLLDGKGGGKRLPELEGWKPVDGDLWVHMDRAHPDSRKWLVEIGLDSVVREALLAEETRPRSFSHGKGLFLVLRAVNLNPGAEPDDMIALRLWIEPHRLITVRARKLKGTHDVASALDAGGGPKSASALMIRLARRITERMEPVIDNLEELADGLEEQVGAAEPRKVRGELAELRRQLIALRRYLSPQRLVLQTLSLEEHPLIDVLQRSQLRELADWSTRHVEELESLRERASVIHDELANHVAEQLNKRMYVLALVTIVFLPLGLITGLLGINVGGMPGATNPLAFMTVCGILVVTGLGILLALRLLRWL